MESAANTRPLDGRSIERTGPTEDAERQGGSEPLDVPYLRASPLLLWRKRVIWLLVLFVAETYTGTQIATIVDGTGLIIYFMIAHATLPQLAGL